MFIFWSFHALVINEKYKHWKSLPLSSSGPGFGPWPITFGGWIRFGLYRGHVTLTSTKIKRSSHAKFQVNWSNGGWVTGSPLSEKPDFAVPLLFRSIIEPYTEYSMISIFLSESCQSQSDVSVRFSDAWKWSLGWEDSVGGGVSTRDSWHMFILDNNISIADMTPATPAVGQLLIILGHICAVLYTEAVLYWCLS